LHLGIGVKEVTYIGGQFQIFLDNGQKIESEALLISVGRKPNVSSLNLGAAGVNYTHMGISVDAYGRTNQSHIWAVGDVVGAPFFTHWAENQGRCVLTSLILPFPFKKKIDGSQSIPRVTYTDPEVASIGLSEKEAKIDRSGRAEYSLAMYAGIPLRKLSALIHPYPTYNGAIRKAADLWLTQTILPILKRKK